MISPSRNFYKFKQRFTFIIVVCLCISFTLILVVLSVYFCLLVYHFFMSVFVVILSSTIICKQFCLLHCCVFVAFVYNFNVKRCKSKIPVSRFSNFVTVWWFLSQLTFYYKLIQHPRDLNEFNNTTNTIFLLNLILE